jgi:hydrophobe/amphiphile efflux-3 (HAE3) family protein
MKPLEKLAELQCKYTYLFILITLIITLILGIGILNTHLQTDLSKEMPQDLEEVKLNNRLSDNFGGQDTLFVLVSIDRNCEIQNSQKDIRSVRVMNLLSDIGTVLKKDNSVTSVTSAASIFDAMGGVPETDEGVKSVLESVPASRSFFNRDNSATFMIVSGSIGSSEEKINNFVSNVNRDIDGIGKPACVKAVITGNPPLRAVLIEALKHDLVFTMTIAAVLIFLLIAVVKRSVGSSIIVIAPLMVGLAWTLGIVGWMNISLSIATAGVGAMILGLGTEYGIFMLERYREERDNGHAREKAMKIALPSVGNGIIGSGLTTVIGFAALVLTPMPMIQNLGKILALGIFCILAVTVFVAPPVILAEEEISEKLKKRILRRGDKK